jgi:hypothetical protein
MASSVFISFLEGLDLLEKSAQPLKGCIYSDRLTSHIQCTLECSLATLNKNVCAAVHASAEREGGQTWPSDNSRRFFFEEAGSCQRDEHVTSTCLPSACSTRPVTYMPSGYSFNGFPTYTSARFRSWMRPICVADRVMYTPGPLPFAGVTFRTYPCTVCLRSTGTMVLNCGVSGPAASLACPA